MINKREITSIRILPNDKKSFPTEDDFLGFISDILIERGGYYYFPGLMMRTSEETLVLFQYSGKIYACGVLLEAVKQKVVGDDGVDYAGYYRFDTNSIAIFEKPLEKEDLKRIYPDFVAFNQAKQIIPLKFLDEIMDMIQNNSSRMNEKGEISGQFWNALEGKEREALVKVRVNQGRFRKRLLARYGKCCLCGVTNQELLIASHIKPWNASTSEEKIDVDNGFLMCPNHDMLFDHGYISFEDNGEIIISDKLSDSDRIFVNVHNKMKIECTEGNQNYLKYHREKILKK